MCIKKWKTRELKKELAALKRDAKNGFYDPDAIDAVETELRLRVKVKS